MPAVLVLAKRWEQSLSFFYWVRVFYKRLEKCLVDIACYHVGWFRPFDCQPHFPGKQM